MFIHAYKWCNRPKHVTVLNLLCLSSTVKIYMCIYLLLICQRQRDEFRQTKAYSDFIWKISLKSYGAVLIFNYTDSWEVHCAWDHKWINRPQVTLITLKELRWELCMLHYGVHPLHSGFKMLRKWLTTGHPTKTMLRYLALIILELQIACCISDAAVKISGNSLCPESSVFAVGSSIVDRA